MASFNLEQLPGNINISVFSGDDFSMTIDLYRDITDYLFEAKVESEFTDIDFAYEAISLPNGTIKLSLSTTDTASITNGDKWYLKWTDADDKTLTLLTGIITVKIL
jgi:hypothetical protein